MRSWMGLVRRCARRRSRYPAPPITAAATRVTATSVRDMPPPPGGGAGAMSSGALATATSPAGPRASTWSSCGPSPSSGIKSWNGSFANSPTLTPSMRNVTPLAIPEGVTAAVTTSPTFTGTPSAMPSSATWSCTGATCGSIVTVSCRGGSAPAMVSVRSEVSEKLTPLASSSITYWLRRAAPISA